MSPALPNARQGVDAEATPVVFVEGFLGRGTKRYWGDIDRYNAEPPRSSTQRRRRAPRRLLFVHLGAASSLHDRACELYYQIKGGAVDYGKAHSDTYGHGRFGRTYEGLYPQWSSANPLHFVGHSFGGLTIWYMQQLLIRGYFSAPAGGPRDDALESDGEDGEIAEGSAGEFVAGEDNGDWVRSLTGICAPFRGTTATYILGESEEEPATIRPLSFGSALYRLIHLYLFADIPSWLKSHLYDFNVDHWDFGRKCDGGDSHPGNSPFSTLLANLARSKWAEGRDCAPYDLTVRRMEWVNRRSSLCSRTYYKSFAATLTKHDPRSGFHLPALHPVLPLTALGYFVGRHSFASRRLVDEISGAAEHPVEEVEPHWASPAPAPASRSPPPRALRVPCAPPGRYDPSEWWENDGLCPLASQLHPGVCRVGYCTCSSSRDDEGDDCQGATEVTPGTWTTHVLTSTSHVDVVPDMRGMLGIGAPRPPWTLGGNAVSKLVAGASGLLFRGKEEVDAPAVDPPGSPSSSARGAVFRRYFDWIASVDDAEDARLRDREERRRTRRPKTVAGLRVEIAAAAKGGPRSADALLGLRVAESLRPCLTAPRSAFAFCLPPAGCEVICA